MTGKSGGEGSRARMARLRKHLGWWAAEVALHAVRPGLVVLFDDGAYTLIEAEPAPLWRFYRTRMRAAELQELVRSGLVDLYAGRGLGEAALVFNAKDCRGGSIPLPLTPPI